jgi:phage tail-like protein
MTAPPLAAELVQAFRFKVTLTLSPAPSAPPPGPTELGDGLFAECSGLELEADVRELLEGGRNNGVVRRVGRVKLVPIVLKRGMFLASAGGYADTAIWDWLTGMVSGKLPIPRYDGMVQVMAPGGTREVARWTFIRALPSKVSGPSLNAKTGEIAIEELHMVHEGLKLEGP